MAKAKAARLLIYMCPFDNRTLLGTPLAGEIAMSRLIFALLSLPMISGCSSFGTYLYRPTNYTPIPQGALTPTVATLSLDASRRLMIAPLSPGQKVCAEPPPDAAITILAKAALEASAKPTNAGEFTGKLNDEFSATALLIAKRTAAVEFWRTTSFAYCQYLLNGWNAEAASYLQTAERISPIYGEETKPKPKP